MARQTLRTTAAVTAALLVLTACSPGGDDATDDGTVAVDDGTSADPEPIDDDGATDDGAADDGAADDGTDDGAADDGGTDDGGTEDGGDPEPDDGATSAPPLSGEASTDDREQEPDGAPDLTIVDVRVGTHDGFDRVVLELEGEGTVGWFAYLDDQAFEDGSGDPIDTAGGAVLNVAVRGTPIPPDRPAGVEAFDQERVAAPAGAQVLTEVYVGIIFEGQQQIVIGLDEQVPYRIARFDDPQRIVIDLLHP